MAQLKFIKTHLLLGLWLLSSSVMADKPDLEMEEVSGSFVESFEDVNSLESNGWIIDNRSDATGKLGWMQGLESIFPAQGGPPNSFITANIASTGNDVICNWLILPDIGEIENLSFYTRTIDSSTRADRLLLMYSSSGGTNTGPCVGQPARGSDFGDFETLLSVNPDLIAGAYPTEWTQFTAAVNGGGRVAFLYFVTEVGQPPFNGGLIAIDTVSLGDGDPPGPVLPVQNVPGLSFLSMVALVLLLLSYAFYRTKYHRG